MAHIVQNRGVFTPDQNQKIPGAALRVGANINERTLVRDLAEEVASVRHGAVGFDVRKKSHGR